MSVEFGGLGHMFTVALASSTGMTPLNTTLTQRIIKTQPLDAPIQKAIQHPPNRGPNYDNACTAYDGLCQGNLSVDRAIMPQFVGPTKEYEAEMINNVARGLGVNVVPKHVLANQLIPTQAEIIKEKVDFFAKKYANDPEHPPNDIIVSNDNYIIDGHHRALGYKLAFPGGELGVICINAPATNVLLEAVSHETTAFEIAQSYSAWHLEQVEKQLSGQQPLLLHDEGTLEAFFGAMRRNSW